MAVVYRLYTLRHLHVSNRKTLFAYRYQDYSLHGCYTPTR